MNVRVVRAGISELPLARQAISEIHARICEGDESLSAFLGNDTCYLYLAVAGTEVACSLNGYALMHPHSCRPQFLLYEIDVRESWRRQGIGSGLIEAFIDEARRLDAIGVWVVTDQANDAAMAMYRKCGFSCSDVGDVVFSLEPSAPR